MQGINNRRGPNNMKTASNTYSLFLFIPLILFLFIMFYLTFGKKVINMDVDVSKNYWYSLDPTFLKNKRGCGCFPNHAKVILENKQELDIGKLKIGDKILSYDSKKKDYSYSPVIFIPHPKTKEEYPFLKIKINDDISITMTENHFIPTQFDIIKKACELKIGDNIQIINSSSSPSFASIQDIQKVNDNGMCTVITENEYIVVNNIVVSSFAGTMSHPMQNYFSNILRYLYYIHPSINKSSTMNKIVNKICENYSAYAP
jgi:hypothetical protein